MRLMPLNLVLIGRIMAAALATGQTDPSATRTMLGGHLRGSASPGRLCVPKADIDLIAIVNGMTLLGEVKSSWREAVTAVADAILSGRLTLGRFQRGHLSSAFITCRGRRIIRSSSHAGSVATISNT